MPSATVHTRFAALAVRLIAKHGRALSLVTTTNSGTAYDPTTSESTVGIVGVQTQFKADEIGGDLVRDDDKLFLVDSAIPITTAMRIVDDSVSYSIKSSRVVHPGMTSILYKVQARL